MGSALRKIASPLTTPLLRKMLDDPQQEVRYFAVTALMRVYRIEHMPSVRLFAQEEVEYLAYWKDRLK
jgi:HEAT repeat protein